MAVSDIRRRFTRGIKGMPFFMLVLTLVLLAGVFLGARLGGKESKPVITGELLGQQLCFVQELATVEYRYTNMGKFENQVDFYGWQVPFTTKRFIVAYDGIIHAGMDLSQADIQVDALAKRVTVTLPKSGILSHEILGDSVQVFDETKNIFNHITIEDFTGFTLEQKSVVEQKAIDGGLLEAASEKARSAIEAFLSLLPGMEEYELVVR